MPALCCGNKIKKVRITTFRERLPEHIQKLTVDVSYTKTEIQPKCIPSPKAYSYDYSERDNDSIASLNPNFGCSKS